MQRVYKRNNFGTLQQVRVRTRARHSIRCQAHEQLAKRTHSSAFSSISNKIFIAVATPVVCTLPHKRHLSHPTQSMIRVTFRKCVLNSSFNIWYYFFDSLHYPSEKIHLLTLAFSPRNRIDSSNFPTFCAIATTLETVPKVC